MADLLLKTDCLTFLQGVSSGSVDLILTDFPYYISRDTGFQNGGKPQYRRIKISKDFGKWDKEENRVNLPRVCQEFYRVLRKGGTAIAFYDFWALTNLRDWMGDAGFRMLRTIEWVKTNPVPLNQRATYLGNARELAIVGAKGSKPTFHGKYDNGLYSFPTYHAKDRFHPTQKPLNLFEALMAKHSNPREIVLDCFLGSGTAAVAARRLNRQIWGCELDSGYYQKLRRRLRDYEE
jgi:DNA modification methylase